MSGEDSRASLARVLQAWNEALQGAAAPGVQPLLRIEAGATLLQRPRGPELARMVAPVLCVAGSCLPTAPPAVAGVVVRPKVQVRLGQGGCGMLAAVTYVGTVPGPAAWPVPEDLAGVELCPFPPLVEDRQVTLRVLRQEPIRRAPVVHVLAGRRQVALPMFSVLSAATDDTPLEPGLEVHSLAHCLGESGQPAAGRAAVLRLRRRGAPLALRVDLLVGHQSERILPPGPFMYRFPWLIGLIEQEDAEPLLVLDPLGLIRSLHPPGADAGRARTGGLPGVTPGPPTRS